MPHEMSPGKPTTRRYSEAEKYSVGWLAGLQTQGRKASTLRGDRQVLNLYLLPRLGHVPLQDLRTPDFDKLYRDLLVGGGRDGRPLSMTSVHHVHAAANEMLNDAERKGLVTRNVARLVDAPSLTTARSRAPEMQVWTPAELAGFLRSIEGHHNEALFRTIAMTGMRRSEAVGLRWCDVELTRGALVVSQAANSHVLMAGVNAKVVSERLGHASVSFTRDTYAHVMPGQQAAAAAAVAALLGPS